MGGLAGGRSLWIVAVLAMLFFAGSRAFGADVTFRWAILADGGNGMQPLDFSGPPIVHSGTALQVYLEHLENCHIYLYLLDSGDDLTPLYPVDRGTYNYGFPRGPRFIPPGNKSFTFVPPPGTERFYLIASAERLFKLEQLTEEFLNNQNSREQQKLLLSEIESAITGHEKKSAAAEQRAPVEKKVRTADGIVASSFIATEVDIADFYGRILPLDHR